MEALNETFDSMPWLLPLVIVLAVWDGVWKMIGMWKAAQNKHLAWFIIIALINSIGIIPILYIQVSKKRYESTLFKKSG
jgi:hypothetical protein